MRDSDSGCELLVVNTLAPNGSPIIIGDQIMQNYNMIFDGSTPGSEFVLLSVSNWALPLASLNGSFMFTEPKATHELAGILTATLTLAGICICLLVLMIVKGCCSKKVTLGLDSTPLAENI